MRFLQRGARRLIASLDAAANRLYGWRANPIHQSGTVAVAMLLTLIATGLYLVFVYRVGSPAASVERIAADPWLGRWIRTLHRYASDLFIVATTLHLLRMFAQRRSWGPRTLAWVSGTLLFGAGLVCAWTGFVMAWDTFGERLARDGARMLDVLPVVSEPVSRIFAGDGPVPSAFFFVNLFMHIVVPLAMGVMLWLHVSRVARPVLLPPKRTTWTIVGVLTVASILLPATLGPAANPFRVATATPTDLMAAWWLPVSEHLSPGAAWAVLGLLGAIVLFVPRLTRRPREGRFAPSVVDPRLCTGCTQCVQDCPWDAITMVPRDDGRETLVAQVNPERCVSCGICAGSCAPMGVGPAARTGRDQLATLRGDVLPALDRAIATPIVAVCCEQAPGAFTTALRARGVYVHSVSCAGNLHSSVIELLVRSGVPGVLVCQCPPRDCEGREGPKWLHARVYEDREAELQPRVDRRRVRVVTVAPGAVAEALGALDALEHEVREMSRPDRDANADVDLTCDTESLGELAS